MDKIIELICEEARRRPGKRLVPKLSQVLAEVVGMALHLIDELIQAEDGLTIHKRLQKAASNDTKIK